MNETDSDHIAETPKPPEWAPPAGKLMNLIPGSYWDADHKRYVSPGEEAWSEERYREVLGLGTQPVSMYDVVEQRGKALLQESWAQQRIHHPKSTYVPPPDANIEYRRMVRYDTLWRRGSELDERTTPNVDAARRINLFGSARNIGIIHLSNMEIVGCLASDNWFAATHLRVAIVMADKTREMDVRAQLAQHGLWHFTVAEMPQKMGFIEPYAWIPLGDVIPPRQNFKVIADLDGNVAPGLNDYQGEGVIRFELHGVEGRWINW